MHAGDRGERRIDPRIDLDRKRLIRPTGRKTRRNPPKSCTCRRRGYRSSLFFPSCIRYGIGMPPSKQPEWKPWKTLDRKVILTGNRFLSVEQHTLQLPDGRVLDDWTWVITPDYVCIAALDPEGRFLCFRQMKYAVKGLSLAPAGGYLEPGEVPEAGARRELLEETGCQAEQWTSLGQFVVDSNRGAGTAYFFLATGVRRICDPVSDDLEEQELLWMSRNDVRTGLDDLKFKTLAWAAIMEMALRKTDPADTDAS